MTPISCRGVHDERNPLKVISIQWERVSGNVPQYFYVRKEKSVRYVFQNFAKRRNSVRRIVKTRTDLHILPHATANESFIWYLVELYFQANEDDERKIFGSPGFAAEYSLPPRTQCPGEKSCCKLNGQYDCFRNRPDPKANSIANLRKSPAKNPFYQKKRRGNGLIFRYRIRNGFLFLLYRRKNLRP